MIDLDGKLEKIQNQMIPLQTHMLFIEFEEKLKDHLEQFNKDILIKKDKKFQRDKRAFEDGTPTNGNQIKPINITFLI